MSQSEPPAIRHLIYSYFVESTGIIEVFRKVFTSFFISDELLKLNRHDDAELIEKIKETINLVYPKPISKITPDFEELRRNAYWRMFGYTIRNNNAFPKVRGFNSEFNKNFEAIMYEIFQIILDKGIAIEKIGNPNALSNLLINLHEMLNNRKYNEIEDISAYWYLGLERLLSLLDDDDFMQRRLNIRSEGRDRRLIELGEKLRVPVAKETLYLLQLAKHMDKFLTRVETTAWTTELANSLANEDFFFKEISSAWYQITGKDFLAEALGTRRAVNQPRTPPKNLPPLIP